MTQRVLGILRLNDSDIALDATHLIEVVRLEMPSNRTKELMIHRKSLYILLRQGENPSKIMI